MIQKLTEEDLHSILSSTAGLADSVSIDDDLESWSIDKEGFFAVSGQYIKGTINELLQGAPAGQTIGSLFYLAFTLGQRTAREVEMRQMAEEGD